MTRSRTGAESFCDALEREGVTCVFGLPGTQTVEIYDALRNSRIRSIVPTHELAAAFMANGYARASGKPGVLLTISGPGVAFAPAGLAEAKLDAVPIVHFTIAPVTGPTGEPGFQAFDQASLVGPIVKATLRADDRTQIAPVVREAFALATAAEPGPVFVEFAPRALRERAPEFVAPARLERPALATSADDLDERSLDAIVDALSTASHPVFFVACDCGEVSEVLSEVAANGRVPVLVPAPHRGIVPENHAWSICCDDQRTSVDEIQAIVAAADLVVVLGTRLTHVATAGFQLKFDPVRTVCVADSGPLPHGYGARISVRCAPSRFIGRVSTLASRFASTWSVQEASQWRERFAQALPPQAEPVVNGGAPAAFFAALRSAVPDDAVVVTDSGLHQALTRRYYAVLSPGGLLFPSDFQSMGFGLPAALGAKLARPDRGVIVVMGDGGFLMSGLDLLTAVRDRIPIVVIVFNDGQLNLIRLQQLREFGRAHGVELQVPHFEDFARAVSVRYSTAMDDLPRVVGEALSSSEPTLIEVPVGDSRAIAGVRAKSLARETVRHAIGPDTVGWLKRFLR